MESAFHKEAKAEATKAKAKRELLSINKMKNKCGKRRAIFVEAVPAPAPAPHQPTTSYNLTNFFNFVYDQGDLGSCTANAFCAAFRILTQVKKKYVGFVPSRLFFYYNERVIEGTVTEDAGADVVDGETYVKANGICAESKWPYVISNFAKHPTNICYQSAKPYKVQNYYVLNTTGNDLVTSMKNLLLSKQPIMIAIAVYDSFVTDAVAATGVVPMPDLTIESCQGGHELCVVGYDDGKQAFLVLNSWGNGWGLNGKCFIPYAYIANGDLCFEVTYFTI